MNVDIATWVRLLRNAIPTGSNVPAYTASFTGNMPSAGWVTSTPANPQNRGFFLLFIYFLFENTTVWW